VTFAPGLQQITVTYKVFELMLANWLNTFAHYKASMHVHDISIKCFFF